MTMPPTELELHAYVDGQLAEADRLVLEHYLASHPEVARRVTQLQQENRQLRAALVGTPSMMGYDEITRTQLWHRFRQRRRHRWGQVALVVLSLGLGFGLGWQSHPLEDLSTPPMADAVQVYRMFASTTALSPDIRFQQSAEVQPWLEARFPQLDSLPDFQAQGAQPVAGRWLVTEAGPAAMVLYHDAHGQPLVFYIRPPGVHMKAAGQRREGNVLARYWPSSSYYYAVVGRADALEHWPKLHPL